MPAAVVSEADGLIVDPSQIGVIGIKVMLLSGRHSDYGGTAFGVRRPLRLLAYKLDLDPNQVNDSPAFSMN